MKINKKLLPIKGHYFLFNAGTAPLVPYLSTYARQLGFSSATVGLIYTVLPIFGLVAKPLFGVIADSFKIQKPIFILFQIVTILSFSLIYVIPQSGTNVAVHLDCGDGSTMLRTCYPNADAIDQCKVVSLGNEDRLAYCDMSCDMSSPKMWETVCEHWHIPQYCYSDTRNITFSTKIGSSSVSTNSKVDECINVKPYNITLDDYEFTPKCRNGLGFVDVNVPCNLRCYGNGEYLYEKSNMTCIDQKMNYKMCTNYTFNDNTNCEVFCSLDANKPWHLMELCEGLGADVTPSCQPHLRSNDSLPDELSFTGVVKLSSTITDENCVFMQLKHILLLDGSIHYPNCVSKAQYQAQSELFRTSCTINCNSSLANELFISATESNAEDSDQYTRQFWFFFVLMIISWIGQAVVVTFADAICFNLLEEKIAHYGKQRLWGSVGWGIFSLLTGVLIDVFSDGAYKNYLVAFVMMFIFMCGDVIASCYLKIKSTTMSMNILSDVGALLTSLNTFVFIMWTIAVGMCTALIWQFLFWHLEDISNMKCEGSDYIKTLQGLVSAIQMFGGEIPLMFLSGFLLRKLGHVNMMSLVLFAFGLRFILYSFLTNAWWVLPIEMLQGITFGMFYPTMTSYATVVSPPGTETTVQGLVGAIFEGVGTSLGSFIGGRLYHVYGGWNTFRWFGIGAFICCFVHTAVQILVKDKAGQIGSLQEYSAVIRYEQPNDMVFMMESENDG